jgi:hypothetical protein
MDNSDSLKIENQNLRKYISLVLAEMELIQRVSEIKENFHNSDDSERIIMPILDRVARIKSERLDLQSVISL